MEKKKTLFDKIKSRFWDVAFFAIVLGILITRIPTWISNSKMEETKAKTMEIMDLNGHAVTLPPPGHNTVLIFWATWCGPCKVELARYNSAVKDGKLNEQRVWAISIGEELEVVKESVRERDYRFKVFADPTGLSGNLYNVSATPTTVHVDSTGKITWVSGGVSPTGIMRAEDFLK